ncbi:MAG: hypothetical protein ABI720_13475 [Actinomycetes bacterium]
MTDETRVRTLLAEYAGTVPVHDFAGNAWDRGRARRRNRRLGGVVAVAAATAVVVLAYSGLDGRLFSEPIPPASPSPSPSPSLSPSPSETKTTEAPKGPPVFKWAQGLPRGEDARAAFGVGGVLYAGDQRLRMPGVPRWHNGVYASTPNGWMISWSDCENQARNCSFNGLMATDGSITTLPYPASGARETFAISPDYSRVMFDRWILDANTGEVLADLPNNVGYINAWTPNGIVYFDERGGANQQRWWQPGSRPIRMKGGADYRSDGLGIGFGGGCSTVQRLLAGGEVAVVMDYCEDDPLADLSPSGTRAVTDSGLIINVPGGRELGSLDVPDNFSTDYYPESMLWEDANNILYVIPDYKATFRSPMLIVRCSATSGECERASATLSDYASFIHLLPLDPEAPRDGTT